jgi:hypothetical protein
MVRKLERDADTKIQGEGFSRVRLELGIRAVQR